MRLFHYNFKPSLHPSARILKQTRNKYFDIQTQGKMCAVIPSLVIHLLQNTEKIPLKGEVCEWKNKDSNAAVVTVFFLNCCNLFDPDISCL